jgi:hypothetical protein
MSRRHWLALALTLIVAQPAIAFDLSAFELFLQENQHLTAQDLLDRHEPYPHYTRDLGINTSGTILLQEVIDRFHLTQDELALLSENGFVISERLAFDSYGEGLNQVWHADLPIFVSSDLILHTMHVSFADVFKSIEQEFVAPALSTALESAHFAWPDLVVANDDDPMMVDCLDDLDVWLTTARSLITGTVVPAASAENSAFVREILGAIEGMQPQPLPLFNDVPRLIDFSQFQVRGYYGETEELQRYFRCMMWLGRVDFRLSPPPDIVPPISVQREIVDTFLVRELLEMSGARAALGDIDALLRAVVGDSDNTTLAHLDQIAGDLGLTAARELWNPAILSQFEAILDSDTYQPQAINSRILMKNPLDPEPLQLAYAFLMLGQRFTIDSHVLGNVVYDRVPMPPFRGLPNPLDVLYALGNDDVVPLLEEDLEYYGYAPNLGALRYLVDSYGEEFWSANLYNHWLSAIRSLNRSGMQQGVPDFMRTGAWQQKQMQTQLTSWTELRHDTILHVKQSYSTGVICSNPHGYVEPVPELYRRVGAMARFALDEVIPLIPPSELATRMAEFYTRVHELMQTLEAIAEKELAHQALSAAEEEFLQGSYVLSHISCGDDVENGWLADLYFDREDDMPISAPDFIVADVHTQPTDESGAPVGHVLHVGTVHPRLGVFIAGCPTSEPIAFVGPVGSMRQFVSWDFERLTDEIWLEGWTNRYATGLSELIPTLSSAEWEMVYTADRMGIRQPGPSILAAYTTSLTDPETGPPPTPTSQGIAWLRNSPNPFNPSTSIGFELRGKVVVDVLVAIYDARGTRVKTLLHEMLQPNTWFLPWDGTDDAGHPVSSGVYFAMVVADGQRYSTKMVMVR